MNNELMFTLCNEVRSIETFICSGWPDKVCIGHVDARDENTYRQVHIIAEEEAYKLAECIKAECKFIDHTNLSDKHFFSNGNDAKAICVQLCATRVRVSFSFDDLSSFGVPLNEQDAKQFASNLLVCSNKIHMKKYRNKVDEARMVKEETECE